MEAIRLLTQSIFMVLAFYAAYAKSTKPEGLKLESPLDSLGAKMEAGASLQKIEEYSRFFNFTDKDNDGRHSKVEYVDNGNYLNPQSRAGIFNASDSDRDGFVSRAEYILNRNHHGRGKAARTGNGRK